VFLMAEFAKCTYNKAFQLTIWSPSSAPNSGQSTTPPSARRARHSPLEIPLEPFGMGMADKQIYGGLNRGGSERLRRIFRLMQTGKVDPTPMTTHEFGFDEIEQAFRMMESKEDGIIKPLIHFD
jgi:threonine dehydrogenase-like Zn-dependent dehydrogenase